MNKKCVIIISLLLAVILLGLYRFMVQGDVSVSQDGRTAIHLNASERDLVLAEMRGFLQSVQQINQAVADDNIQGVIDAAKRVGRAAQAEVPMSLMGKLPLEFKKLGFDTHQRFDQIALDAEEMGDTGYALKQLSELMNNCVACHAAHRFEVSKE